jgi:hypothetical protein
MASIAGITWRTLLLIGLAVWTFGVATGPINAAGDSFLHMINLPFHEAGHVLFSPLGRFMMILGGSAMQVLVPLVCAGALWFQNGDRFGAALCAWWMGENLMDLAPYIDDARTLRLMLLGGPANAVEGHDWEAILTSLGWLHLDHTLGHAAHLLGAAIMWVAIVAAAMAIAGEAGT